MPWVGGGQLQHLGLRAWVALILWEYRMLEDRASQNEFRYKSNQPVHCVVIPVTDSVQAWLISTSWITAASNPMNANLYYAACSDNQHNHFPKGNGWCNFLQETERRLLIPFFCLSAIFISHPFPSNFLKDPLTFLLNAVNAQKNISSLIIRSPEMFKSMWFWMETLKKTINVKSAHSIVQT